MASGGPSTKLAPMPRTMKPPPVEAKPQPGGGHSHSQLGGRSMATLAADAAASEAQTHAHRGGGGQMNEAQAKTGLKEAVDAVVNSFAKHMHGHGKDCMIDTSGPDLLQQVVTMHMLWELDHILQRLQTAPVLWSPPCWPQPGKLSSSTASAKEVVSQDPVKLIEQTLALISQGLNLPSATQAYTRMKNLVG